MRGGSPDNFDAAFRAATAGRAEALLVLPGPTIIGNLNRIADLATKHKLPAIYEQREFVEGGGLISYGANSPTIYRRAAYFVDKILKGAKPADHLAVVARGSFRAGSRLDGPRSQLGFAPK